jgi:hypothetical protein
MLVRIARQARPMSCMTNSDRVARATCFGLRWDYL